MSVATALHRVALGAPEHPALVHGDERLTYGELASRVARIAGALAERGLRPGDRVAVLQWNGPRLLESMLAAFHGGFVVVPVNARSTVAETEVVVEDAEPAAIVYTPEYAEHVGGLERSVLRVCTEPEPGADLALERALADAAEPAPALVDADDPAWLFYTSGTTGRPKGATLTHRNLGAMVLAYLADVRDLGPESRVLHAAPLTHGSGLYALPAIVRGSTQHLTTSRSYAPAEVLANLAERGITDIAFLTPTMIRWLTEEAGGGEADAPALENVVYGGAPMYREDLVAALDRFGCVFTQIYGQAEAPVTITRLRRADHAAALAGDPDLLLSAGRPYANAEVAVRDGEGRIVPHGSGEILARGDAVMAGYWRNPEATAETLRDGWLHTGDIGTVEPDGLLRLLDRTKDVVISGGANIYPREVEEVLLEHPGIKQAAVIGAPDDEWGERVVAILVPENGHDPDAIEREALELCRARLAGYKLPRQVEFRDALPTSSYGKVLKRELRDAFWQGRERRI